MRLVRSRCGSPDLRGKRRILTGRSGALAGSALDGPGHGGYTFKHQLWVSIDATFYAGGETYSDGVGGDTRQENSRLGATLSLPLKRGHTIKLLVAQGVTARVGSSFETYSIAYQFLWFD